EGELMTVLGPSGCGKTTALKIIAGLEEADKGKVFLEGNDVTEKRPEERDIGMVFQRPSLFPRMTVEENIEYALSPHTDDRVTREERIEKCLKLVNMIEARNKYPEELSGGEARRVELARTVSYKPDVILLDEPLTGLDRSLRREMRKEIKRVQRGTGTTTVFVTHNQEEAIYLSDRMAVLRDGKKEQEGTPEELYRHPENEFVAEFMGESVRF
ncbi:MAG: ABC transporter ATP-binding protein, partial [Halobacteria archaeon]|nr:ABC transporter ATP-binding protein [Halobacteria archaeon]